jgi:RHS repeat-associated protein
MALSDEPVAWHTQVLSREFNRVDDPDLALEIACRAERNNLAAARIGLPTIGQELHNPYGLSFRVREHLYLPTVNTAHRWHLGERGLPEDLYPVIEPLNMSPRFMDFIGRVDRCTTKVFVPVDTTPALRRNWAHRHNSIHSSDPRGLLVFLDAATLHETVFAHEVGHAWVQYVDQCEDERTLADISDSARLNQFNFIQSYVLDLKVNELLRRKGFDMEPIDGDQGIAMATVERLLDSGFTPETRREAVFTALQFADHIVERERGNRSSLARFDDVLTKLKSCEPEIYRLATGMADAVFEFGIESKEGIAGSIDRCLQLSFEYTGDPLDLEKDLVVPPSQEPDFDKWPDWIPGAFPRVKCQIGRMMALHDIPLESGCSLACEPISGASVSFQLKDGTVLGPWRISTPYPAWHLHQMQELDAMNKAAANRHAGLIEEVMQRNRQIREAQQSPLTGPHPIGHPTPYPTGAPQPGSMGLPFSSGRRPYMAGLARFLTQARLSEILEGEHPYAYADNNPTTYTDPMGLWARKTGPCNATIITPGKGDRVGVVVGPGGTMIGGGGAIRLFGKPGENCVAVNAGFFGSPPYKEGKHADPIGDVVDCAGRRYTDPRLAKGEKYPFIRLPVRVPRGRLEGRAPSTPGGANPGKVTRTGACTDKNGNLISIVVIPGVGFKGFEDCMKRICPKGSTIVLLDGGGSSQIVTDRNHKGGRPVHNWIVICD